MECTVWSFTQGCLSAGIRAAAPRRAFTQSLRQESLESCWGLGTRSGSGLGEDTGWRVVTKDTDLVLGDEE